MLAEAGGAMTKGGLPALLYHLRRSVPAGAGDPSVGDADLLGRFVDSRDGFAFEALMRRHASMVWNVCRRVLPDDAHAEDASQAVFLTLVRKAHTIGRRASVAGWLHKVAYRVALEARRQVACRAAREVPVMEHQVARSDDDAAWRELRLVLDEEVCQLPEKYRAPVVLCYLQGRSNAEAARQLGCPSGTVVTRLAWARRRLRQRLTRRGLSASTGLLTAVAVLVRRAGAAMVPPRLVDATLRSSLLLAAGETAAAGAQAASALYLSRAATGALWAARVKFAVAAAACLVLAGGAAALRGQRAGCEPSITATTAPVRGERTAAWPDPGPLKPGQIVKEPNSHPDEDPPPRITAYFERADLANITVTFRGKHGAVLDAITLSVAADAKITRNGKPLRLVDLKPGWRLRIMLSADESKAVTIRVMDD
jgi:RNA polymerase sigma factor (sigma-70 family)